MTEKILLKITWDDIRRYFGKAIRECIMKNTPGPRIIIPTKIEFVYFSELKQCIEDWKALDARITTDDGGFIVYEIAWDNNYCIELDVQCVTQMSKNSTQKN